TCGVAAWPRQAVDETGAQRIGNADENDRNATAETFHRRHAQRAAGENDVRCERRQLGSCERSEAIQLDSAIASPENSRFRATPRNRLRRGSTPTCWSSGGSVWVRNAGGIGAAPAR